MSKTITYLEVRRKEKCKQCNGTGEVMVREDGEVASTDCRMFSYVCPKCMGKKFTMETKTISLEQFKELKN